MVEINEIGKQKPKRSHNKVEKATLASKFCDSLETYLNWWVTYSPKDDQFMSGGFAPVEEGGLAQDLPVKGVLPECLNGEFVRNGPNPKFEPIAGYHWFDGDGMLHGVRIKNGRASYVNRFVRTSRLLQEEQIGAPKFLKIGEMGGYVGLAKIMLNGLRKSLGVLDASQGEGTGNTSLAYHNGRLMATHEGDAPYVVRVLEDGELETVGRMTYGGTLNHPFTAHPKVDPVTDEMFTFGYSFQKSPYVTYRVVSADGTLGAPVPITIPRPVMMHDFAITEQYAIFMDLPLVFKPDEIVKSGFPFIYDPKLPARFGVLPRYASSEAAMKWFELPSHFIFHTANAWEEGEEVVLVASHIPHMDLSKIAQTEQEVKHLNTMHEYRFNMATGEASMRQLADFFSDFPRINESYLGRKQRYVYCSVMKVTKIVGVAKYDLSKDPVLGQPGQNIPRVGGTCVGYFPHGPGRFGSEPVFVPRVAGTEGDEDDGYLLNFVHDETTGKSEMVVVDARTMACEPVAVVHLPRRVPYGFHGIFVSEEQLHAQDQAPLTTANGETGVREPLLVK